MAEIRIQESDCLRVLGTLQHSRHNETVLGLPSEGPVQILPSAKPIKVTLRNLMNRTSAAFLISADTLFDMSPKVYFWTITWRETLCDWQYPRLFHGFMRDLRKKLKTNFCGLRVVEPHKSHGLHYHMLLDTRIPVDLVRKIGGKYGIGRVHVCIANPTAKMYLAKYLMKSNPDKLHGPRRWWRVGTWDHTPCNRIVVESVFHDNVRELFWGKKRPYNEIAEVMAFTQVHGPWREWPDWAVERNAFIAALLVANGIVF